MRHPNLSGDASELPLLRGAISLRNVSFCYSDTGPDILHDLTLRFPLDR